MYALFSCYYENSSAERFEADLADKSFVILLEDGLHLAGFTSAEIFDFDLAGKRHCIVFSGDTIIDHLYWGQQAMAKAWLHMMGKLARQSASPRLSWFLIVKGHRTYRYLPAFALRYVPSRSQPQDADLLRLRDALAAAKFGGQFDPASGIIRFERRQGNLRAPWAAPSGREARLPDVAYFLGANPGHARGDELACLTDICRSNMRPLAQRWFDEGYDAR